MPNPPTPQYGQYSIDDFAGLLKSKYPEYAKTDNTELVQRVIQKYPEYQKALSTETLQKSVNPSGSSLSDEAYPRLGRLLDFLAPRTANPTAESLKQSLTDLVKPQDYSKVAPTFKADPLQGVLVGVNAVVQQARRTGEDALGAVASVPGFFLSPFNPELQKAQTLATNVIKAGGGASLSPEVQSKDSESNAAYAWRTANTPGAFRFNEPNTEDIYNQVGGVLPFMGAEPLMRMLPGAKTNFRGGAYAETPAQAASTPNPVHSFTGADGPMRPYDPQGTRFAQGDTVGMDPISTQPPAPSLGPADHISAAGLVNRGQLMKNAGPFGVEHPDFKNVTASINPEEITSPDAVKQAVARKLNEVADKPPGQIPGQQALDPAAMRSAAQKLLQPDATTVNSEALQQVPSSQTPPEQFIQGLRDETNALRDRRVANPNAPEAERFALDKRILENQEMIAQREGLPSSDPRNAPSPTVAREPVTSFDTDAFNNTQESVWRAQSNLASPNLTERGRGNWDNAIKTLRGGVRDNLNDFLQRLTPESHEDTIASVQAESARLREQANAGRGVVLGDPLVKAMRQEMATGRPIRPWMSRSLELKGKEEGAQFQEVGQNFPGELRDAFHQILGDKVTTEGGIPPSAMDELKAKAQEGLKAARAAFQTRAEAIATRTGDANISKAELLDKALREEKLINGRDIKSEIVDLQSILGTSRERLRYQSKGAPVTDAQGVVRPPGVVGEKTLAFANEFFGTKNINKIPEDAKWEARAKHLEDRATLLDTVANRLRERKARFDKGNQGGFIGESGQGGHAGGNVSSVEELERPGRFVKISRSGMPTDQGKVPDFLSLRPGEAGYQVRPDGSIELKAGEETAATKSGAQQYAKSVYGPQRGASGIELMGSSAAGMATGAAVGYRVGGVPGAIVGGAVGYGAGFMLPALYRIPAVADVLTSLGKEVRDLGFSTAGGAKDLATGLINFLAPKVGVDTKTLNSIMQMKGDAAQTMNAAANVLQSFRKNIDQLPKEAQIDFIDRYKTGQPQASPELQALDGMIRQLDKENYDKITLFKPGTPFLDNHFRMLYKTIPGATEEGFQNWLGKRPLAGSRGFLQQHVYDTLSDAMSNGGVPVTTNPIDMFLMSHGDVQRFIHANMLWENWKADSTATFIKQGDTPPQGYVPLDDRIAKVYFPAKSGEGLVNPGQYYVQEGAGRLMNNYLSPDYIRQNVLGKKIVDAKNIWNGWELLGGFHAVTINGAALVQNLNLAAQRMYNLGIRGGSASEFMGGVRDLINAPTELVRGNAPAYMEGKRLQAFGAALDRAKRGDQSALSQFTASDDGQKFLQKYPGAEALLGDAFTGGLNLKMAEELRSNISKSMLQSFADKKYITGTAKLAPAGLYEMNRPLFDYYIPRVKLGMFIRDMSQQLKDRAPEILNGTLTREELARKVVNRTENVFGEMNFDNLFWNKTFKTSMQLFYRSVTWRLGTTLAEGQGIVGQGRELVNAAKTGTMPRLDPSFGFVAGSLLTLGVTAGVMQKLMSGQNPQSITDLTHPRTGEKNEQGRPVRLNIPGYGTEFSKLSTDPGKYMVSGRAGWVDKLMESWQNKDFYGKQIADPNDSKSLQFAARVLHVITPQMIVSSNIDRMKQTGATPGATALGLVGFSTASKQLDMTPAELKAQEIMVRSLPQGGRSDQQVARAQALNNVLRTYQNKGDLGGAIQEGIKAGTLYPQDMDVSKKGSIPNRIQTPYIQSLLSGDKVRLNDILSVYDVATKDERNQLKPLIRSHISELEKTDPNTRMKTIERVISAMRN